MSWKIAAACILALGLRAGPTEPENRALAYLEKEAPRWSKENHCFSCHNNGDAARALFIASRLGRRVPEAALADTLEWLRSPSNWDNNRGNPAFSDKKLARIQFAASLVEAFDAGMIRNRRPLAEAARSLVRDQDADGSWQVDTGAVAGSPATYGATLATYMARRTLERAGRSFAPNVARANQWLRRVRPPSLFECAALILALPGERPSCLDRILSGQTSDGGWGPELHAPAEPFDTAIVLLALRGEARAAAAVARGRAWLVRAQLPSGGWTETTRPAGAQSYAQHISTSGWAAIALLLTDAER